MTGDKRWKERGEELLRAFAGRGHELGLYAATYLLAVDWHLNPVAHLVLVGDSGDPAVQAMHRASLSAFLPRRVVQLVLPTKAGDHAMPEALKGVVVAGKAPRGYACTGFTCSQPADDLSSWLATLESLRPTVPA
jgi:uncharacterized protein YyaL (SSP411 family)